MRSKNLFYFVFSVLTISIGVKANASGSAYTSRTIALKFSDDQRVSVPIDAKNLRTHKYPDGHCSHLSLSLGSEETNGIVSNHSNSTGVSNCEIRSKILTDAAETGKVEVRRHREVRLIAWSDPDEGTSGTYENCMVWLDFELTDVRGTYTMSGSVDPAFCTRSL